MGFSEAQERAIRHREGPMMVLAGPGSGKTTVITHRVKYLTEECGVNPADILVITFTRAAAVEMKERYERLTGRTSRVSFGTFHAVFFRILKLAYRYGAENIVREEQQVQFLRELFKEEELDPEDENEFISSVLSEISSVKGEIDVYKRQIQHGVCCGGLIRPHHQPAGHRKAGYDRAKRCGEQEDVPCSRRGICRHESGEPGILHG